MGKGALLPDLEMVVRVLQESGRTKLTYTLHSPTGVVPFYHQEILGPTIQGSPEEYHSQLLHKMENLGSRLDVDGSPVLRTEIDRKLADLGQGLWRDLFPLELIQAYREIRRSVKSWMIVSNEPWIPWELIKPYDYSRPEEVIDDDFLALGFELTRWLTGSKPPASEIKVGGIVAIRTSRDLPQSNLEQRTVGQMAAQLGVEMSAFSPMSSGELLDVLQTGGAGILHFLGHGTFSMSQPDESAIPLPDRSSFRPTDLEGSRATQIGRDRPLVFLNSCWAGQQGWSLTRIGGWASRWVGICGSGALIAPMWPIRDQAAVEFARVFYEAMAQGAPLGHAALQARRHLRETRPGDPSALAYTVYGHPNARFRTAEGASASDKAELPPPLSHQESAPVASPSRHVPPRVTAARSSILQIKRQVSDRDRDDFLHDSFDFIAAFFENSLAELEQQNAGLETRFRRDGDRFTATIYLNGDEKGSCQIWIYGNRGIAYSAGRSLHGDSYNEVLTIEDKGESLGLRALMDIFGSTDRKLMTSEEAADYLWNRLLGPLK